MERGISNFIKVWLSVFISLCYCYKIGKSVSTGPQRLLYILPIVGLFLFLPLKLSTLHIGGIISFSIAWLANFKLLLFAFGKGPLSFDPSVSLGVFVAIACLPIKVQPSTSAQKSNQNDHNKENPHPKMPKQGLVSFLNYALKGLLLAIILKIYDYSEYIHAKILWVLYCCHIYIFLELQLVVIGALARALLGLELEPQFNEPYLSTSIQDFWGRRWNLIVTSILRPTVYDPTRNFFKSIVGRKGAAFPAVLATFLVSGIMHELIFYYLGRMKPTWEVSLFFLLHGCCLMVEVVLKDFLRGKFQFPRLISRILTIGFVLLTCLWLFMPPFLRFNADVRMLEEYTSLSSFLQNISSNFVHQTYMSSSKLSPIG